MATSEPQPSPRSTTISREILDQYRKNKGWTDLKLALEAELENPKTIERGRAGEPILLKSARNIARALGIELELLINGVEPPIPEPDLTSKRFEVRLHLATPRSSMRDPRVLHSKIALLQKVIAGIDPPQYKDMLDGSTILILQMLNADILRLLAAMMDGTLENLDVMQIFIPNHSWIIRMIAMLKWRGNPLEPDDEGWNEYINAGEWDVLRTKTSNCFFCRSTI